MPRRNKRESYTPLDLTQPLAAQADLIPPRQRPYLSPRELADLEGERAQRQRMARINQGIDWSMCLVPGCGRALADWNRVYAIHQSRRDPERSLPLCSSHAVIVWQQVQRHRALPDIMETAEQLAARHHAEAVAIRARSAPFSPDAKGQLYFVRINDLVKVGWTQTLKRRLKEYGAGAEILCHYPGTRADETRLHRRLTAVRAKGREWYHDSPLIQRYVQQALEEFGPPTVKAAWTVPKNPVTVRHA